MKNIQNKSGFSLSEIAVVLIIISSIVGVSLSAGQSALKIADVTSANNNLAVIQDALHLFREKQGRYPCPAVGSDAPADVSYGKEAVGCDASCPVGLVCPASTSAVIGVLPYKDLGLNDSLAFDSEDNKITYVVDSARTLSSEYELGNIVVHDKSGNDILQSPSLGDAIFVLISHGEDGNGAWPKTGVTQNACGATSLDIENCNDDDVFMSAPLNESKVAANYFDDFVLWYAQERIEEQFVTRAWDYSAAYINSIYVGGDFSCGIDDVDYMWCWGRNTFGRLGDGTTTSSNIPINVSGGYKWSSLAFGGGTAHTCGIKTDNTAWCWGFNNNGQLGDNTASDSSVPVAVVGGDSWKYISVSHVYTTCGIKIDDTGWCWGLNSYGQLGDGTTSASSIPILIAGGGTWKKIAPGGQFTCGIKSDDTLWCWGQNNQGQLGTNTYPHTNATPAEVAGGGSWKDIASGGIASCAIKSDDTLWCWGENNMGQLGDGTTTNRSSPTAISGGGSWKSIATGAAHACGIKADDTLWCWGYNHRGQIGDGTTTNRSSPTAVSGGGLWSGINLYAENTCGIKTDNTAWCWGDNVYGQIGDNSSTQRLVPTSVYGANVWRN